MAEKNTKSKSSEEQSGSKESFFQSFISSLFNRSSPEAEKKKKLKAIAKAYSKSKFHSFYKPANGEMTGAFGKFMFDLYKVVSPAQIAFTNAQNPAIFTRQLINYIMSDNQLELLEQFDENNILEMSKKVPFNQLQKDIEQKLQIFLNEFDGTRMARAENLSRAFAYFKDFCMFDYYVIIRKYDPQFQEYSFDRTPRLEKVNAEYVIDDLKDFLAVAYLITDDSIAWTELFEMMKATQNKELVSAGNWKKIIARIRAIQASHSLDMIIQHASEDPAYQTELKSSVSSVVEPFMDKIEADTHALLNRIQAQQKESKANSICVQIFGTSDPQSMKNYVPSFNSVLEKKDLTLLEYAEPLNYLKTFLIEFVKKTIREYYEVVVIRGQWDATLSAPMSNSYQELLKMTDDIVQFDDSFAEEGVMGSKIKTLLPKTAHDAGAENIINRVVSDANDLARGYIIQGTQNLITIGKTIKQLIEDYSLPKPVIVQNWKELEKFFDEPIKEISVDIYKKIYLFAQLMQTYIQ
ncbi:MAG: hypothetical protein K5681_06800 [Treponema sp.]|nr:hypothetical protein [Treponema sp.]